jgi:hypothetical protein
MRGGAIVTRLAACAALAVALTGCAAMFGAQPLAPSGLAVGEDRLRHMLASGQAQTAFARLGRNAPDDEMLRALYHGVVAYHAGDYAESARVLDIAAVIADERMTKSLSRAALSLVSNDLVLHYEPGPTERLMIPYYGGLARLQLGDVEGAAVEARRLSLLLQQYEDRDRRVDPALRANLRLVAGALFEAAGEYADADVAYRNAAAIDSSLAGFDFDATRRGRGRDSATVIVILEQGFVAHRVEQALAVMLLPEEVEAIAHGGLDEKATVSAFVAGRILERATYAGPYYATPPRGATLFVPAPERTIAPKTRRRQVCTTRTETVETSRADSSAPGTHRPASTRTVRECEERDVEVEGLPYLLKVAWPVYRSDYRPAPVRLLSDGSPLEFGPTADLSRSVMSDFDGERLTLIARTIARGTAKLAVTKGAERSLEEKSEVAGRIVGLLGNIGNVLLERADTRSWHLLPAGVSVARLRLPPGEHELTAEVGGRIVPVGAVTARAGHVTIVPVRAY